MSTTSGPSLASHPRLSLSYHLFSTVTVVAWSIFITATLITLELTHRATWDYSRVANNEALPWAFSVLPSILRTIFDQGHGTITAMHLARLAVGSLDISWTSANTWMEVFWLSDRRWAGPFGLWMTLKTLISRKRRKLRGPHVSLGFWLLTMLSIVTLVTPVTLSRAYHVTMGLTKLETPTIQTSEMTTSWRGKVAGDHAGMLGRSIWVRGFAPALQFPDNMYAEPGVQASSTSGAWFITGWTDKATVPLIGIRVEGGCERILQDGMTLQDQCTATFGDGSNSTVRNISSIPLRALHEDESPSSGCYNIPLDAEFGRKPHSNASVIFQSTLNLPTKLTDTEIIVGCNVTVGVGVASVNGRTMTFSNFTYIAFNLSGSGFLDPLAYFLQAESHAFVESGHSKSLRHGFTSHINELGESWTGIAEVAWDGIVSGAMGVAQSTLRPVNRTGTIDLPTSGIRRDTPYFITLCMLLGVWFVGMFGLSAVLLRSTWASSLDGYAVAKLLQQQPVLTGTSEAWLTELEDSQDILQEFKMHKWRDSKS